jgi:large subunit ribosomal protein L29
MSDTELREKMDDLNLELSKERGKNAVGGFPDNEGRIKEIRRTVARIKTVLNENQEEQ